MSPPRRSSVRRPPSPRPKGFSSVPRSSSKPARAAPCPYPGKISPHREIPAGPGAGRAAPGSPGGSFLHPAGTPWYPPRVAGEPVLPAPIPITLSLDDGLPRTPRGCFGTYSADSHPPPAPPSPAPRFPQTSAPSATSRPESANDRTCRNPTPSGWPSSGKSSPHGTDRPPPRSRGALGIKFSTGPANPTSTGTLRSGSPAVRPPSTAGSGPPPPALFGPPARS